MKKNLFLLCMLVLVTGNGQSFQTFYSQLLATPAAQRQTKVDSFMLAIGTTPLIEHDTICNFLYQKPGGTVTLIGDMNDWDNQFDQLSRIPSTDLFFLVRNYPDNARFDYLYEENGINLKTDPNNPNQITGVYGLSSEVRMPQFVQPWEIQSYPGTAKGSLYARKIYGGPFLDTFNYQIYLPPGYDSLASINYPVAYFQDGSGYLQFAFAANVIDNLIDSALIEPIIAVFIDPNDRNAEYAYSRRVAYQQFFVNTLIPHLDATLNTKADSMNRATIGTSFGGNISLLLAYNYPHIFYKTGQHSSVVYPNNTEAITILVNSGIKDMHFAAIWGSYDELVKDFWPSVKDSMNANSFINTHFNNYPDGHNWGLWRATLDEILIHLFPPGNIGVNENEWKTLAFYPNPTSGKIHVDLDPNDQLDWIEVHDINGRSIVHITSTDVLDISNQPDGIYILSLSINGQTQRYKVLKN